ncbi:DNA primase [Paenibacillus darwinianus]|uniref:DNA primase n=1 Tax=Paenibacillus darwinianus TaxID=1380763 RepID=A0A9W5S1U9_9BACL|nr:toprim domain-containing protein [Paenibacillus darwinianus]EXX87686.1 DNA primase [Paenibacillus darwinianus]EXX89303.1 DNA primase [Paenibacillus darwinianus]EXX90118.1 DNA primase [Paenibacillus darwinianus]
MEAAIIVEGKSDRSRLRRLVTPEVEILCTYGTPGSLQMDKLSKQVGRRHVYIFTDNDASGKRIRGMLRDAFPDADHIYTRRGYPGVEGTPDEYLIQQLEKAGLEEYLIYPEPAPSIERWTKEDGLL